MPLTPERKEMLKIAEDSTSPAHKLISIYETLFPDAATTPNFVHSRVKEKEEDKLFLNALAVNPNTPPKILYALRQYGSLLINPVFVLVVIEEPKLLEQQVLLRLLHNAPTIHKNNRAMFTENPDATVREESSLHVSIAGEADVDWRDEVGPMLARGCGRGAVRDFIEERSQIPDWVRCHYPNAEGETESSAMDRLQVFGQAYNLHGRTRFLPWYHYLGHVLLQQNDPTELSNYVAHGNRFVRAAAKEFFSKEISKRDKRDICKK